MQSLIRILIDRRKKKRTSTPSVEESSQNVTGYVNTSFVDVAEQTRHHARDDTDAASGAAGNNEVRIPISPLQHIPLEILPTDYNRELTWEDISLTSNLLGAGHFGEVRKGTVMVDGERIPSAIKILKRGADDTSKQDFQQEVNIMRHVGYHPNIINLLGFCIYQGQQYMALEMAGNGDLLKFLRNSRMQEVVTPTYANSRSDFNGRTLSTLSPVQLLRIACDVATGMGHLSAKEVIHRDLAARNVLLTDNLIAKVADFGLSRGEGIYEQTSKRAIPFRSTAIEALTRRIYTTKSDIWSFGILLWEIVTIGGTPYRGMKSRTILGRLRDGYRLPKPRNCEAELYQLMMLCWKTRPEDRPTFIDLAEQLEGMIEDKHSYVNIDKDDDFEYEVVDSDGSDGVSGDEGFRG
ncbi:tyrosine-protein kinase receptor Tie-1-like [Branchiostoma lanceolatum]|uniref:tyrosine-protein kinase receptor Tie-1-like n=1 Tax=Branchiostoma lanceolatum TaxID=7740 RepID=UPI003452B38D